MLREVAVCTRGCRRPRSVTCCGHAGDRGVRTRPITSASRWSRRTPHTDPRANRRREDAKDWSSARGATTDYGGNCTTETTECTRGHAGDHGGHHTAESEIPRCGPPVSPVRGGRAHAWRTRGKVQGPPPPLLARRGKVQGPPSLAKWSDLYPGPVSVQLPGGKRPPPSLEKVNSEL